MKRREFPVIPALVVLTFAVFGRVASHAFLNFDDDQIVARNFDALKWTPLTALSHWLDLGLWGPHAGLHALTNVALHAANAALLYTALRRMTRPQWPSAWPSAFVAAVFAVHPMHVESVAWISERKDTLSTFFALLAILAYPKSKVRVAVMMALSLLAKPMHVTLPFVLLLLDLWPLRRLDDLRARLIEKIPLFALSAGGVALAVVGQTHLRAVQASSSVANALVAYVRYLGKFFVPLNLAIPYPMTPVSTAAAIGAAALLTAITVAVWRWPHARVGWLWFLGTLVPVIGFVQIGVQSMADRYSYFPYIGLSLIVALAVGRRPLAVMGISAVLAVLSFRQVGYWKDSETLFAHSIAVTPPNAVAEYNLGQALELDDPDRAIAHLKRAIELQRDFSVEWYPQAWVGLGTAHLVKAQRMPPGEWRTAAIQTSMECNRRALELDPNAPHAANNLKVAAQMLGR